MKYFLALLITIASVAASLNISVVNHDTDVQSTYEYLKACSCGRISDEFIIKNIGDLSASYVFQLEQTQEWSWLEKKSVFLKPSETASVFVYTQPPCGSIGTTSYTVAVASEYGRYRALEKTIETGVCENIRMSITPRNVTIEPCGSQQFNLTLTNVATFRDHYTVDGLGFSSVTLDAGETATLQTEYTATCSEYGTTEIPVSVHADNNDRTEIQTVSVLVPRSYDYTVALGDVEKPVCVNVKSTIPVTIDNIEDRGNTFTIKGEPWSNTTSTYVRANRERTVDIPFTPEKPGYIPFTANVEGRNGSITKQATITIPVEACYGYTLEAVQTVNACPGNVYIPFTIKSTGTQTQTITFDVQSNATTHADKLEAKLNPGQQFDRTVTVDIGDIDRSYYVTFIANSTYNRHEQTTIVSGYSTESCYAVMPESTKFKVWTDQTILPVIIKHTGIEPATYTITYDGEFMAPVEKEITLGPGGQAVLHFTINTTGYETGRYVDRLTLSTHDRDYTTDFEVTLREKGFLQHFLDACNWNGDFGVCSATSSASLVILIIVMLLILGISAGIVHYENPVWLSRETTGIVGGALLIILLAAMIATAPIIPLSYERPVEAYNESALFFEIGQDQVLTLDPNRYFFDPDNDNLSFTANQPNNLLVKVDKNTLQIRGKSGFKGQDTVVFTADDGKGALTDSRLITVSVVSYKPVTFLEYWMHACWFITFLLLFIAITLALMTILFLKDVKPLQERRHAVTLYRKPRTLVVHGEAHDLVQQADTKIKTLPPGTTIGQVVGTQVIQQKDQDVLVASAEGTKFHRMTCPVVKNIPKEKRQTFLTKEEALKAGYSPCKTCSSHA